MGAREVQHPQTARLHPLFTEGIAYFLTYTYIDFRLLDLKIKAMIRVSLNIINFILMRLKRGTQLAIPTDHFEIRF